MLAENKSKSNSQRGNNQTISAMLRSSSGSSEAERPYEPIVGGHRLFILFLYASVLVVASIEFFASQRLWYGSWEIYNIYVLTVTGVFVLLGIVMLFSSRQDAVGVYTLPISRTVLGLMGFGLLALSGLALLIVNKSLEEWAIILSITLIYGFLMVLVGARGFDTKDTFRLTVYATGLMVMIMVPVHEAFGVAVSPPGEYPFTLLNLILLAAGMSLATLSVAWIQSRDGFLGAWLLGAMAIFLIAFHEQIGIVASGNYSPYDRALALIGVAFSFLPLVMYAWRERVYFFIWKKLKTANSLIESGDYQRAMKDADLAIKECSKSGIEDRFALPWSLKADALYRMKVYDKARVHYETSLGIDPNDSTSWCHMGNMNALEGKQEAALKAYDQALKVDPKNGFAWNNKGAVYQSLGMFEEALVCFDKATRFMPDSFDPHINMAALFSKLGHSSDALYHYRKALEARPKSSAAREGIRREFFRGMCLDQINGWEQLGLDTSYLRKILEDDPSHFVKRSKEFLKNIVEQKTQLSVVPSSEHIDVQEAMQAIMKVAEEPGGATLDRIEDETNLKRRDIVLPLALLMETDNLHFKIVGKKQVYVAKGKAPTRPLEPEIVTVEPEVVPVPPLVEEPEVKRVTEERIKPEAKPEPEERSTVPKMKKKPKAEHEPEVKPEPEVEPEPQEPPPQPPHESIKVEVQCPGCGFGLAGHEEKCPLCDLPLDTATIDCPKCHEDVPISSDACPSCGVMFDKPSQKPAVAVSGKREAAKKEKKKPGLWSRVKKGKALGKKEKKEPERKPPPKKEAPKKEPPKKEPPKKGSSKVEPKEPARKPAEEEPRSKREVVKVEPTASILVFRRKK